jgi:hypothetical protein
MPVLGLLTIRKGGGDETADKKPDKTWEDPTEPQNTDSI